MQTRKLTEFHQIIDDVLSLESLRPSIITNRTFGNLVSAVTSNKYDNVSFDNALVSRIQAICSDAEFELERYWTNLITNDKTIETLKDFPYLTNYQKLSQLEGQLLIRSGLQISHKTRVLFVGCGPLPLTSYYLYKLFGCKVDHLDISQEAIEYCTKISSVLGLEANHYIGNAMNIRLDNKYDAVMIASLAGNTAPQKQLIINNLLPNLSPNGRVLLRSAIGARSLLYASFDASAIENLDFVSEYHPKDDIINSVYIYKKQRSDS